MKELIYITVEDNILGEYPAPGDNGPTQPGGGTIELSKDWKMLLYEYAERHNETTFRGNLGMLDKMVDDLRFLEQHEYMLKRVGRERKRRSIQPLQAETRAKIMRADEKDDQVTAELRYQVKLTYQQSDERFEEQYVMHEHITLSRDQAGWRITHVRPSIAERKAMPLADVELSVSPQAEVSVAGSRPLLNTHLLYGWQSDSARSGSRKSAYNRQRVKEYADQYWNSSNPSFLAFEVDCTNYVSQCLLAGGAPMNYTGRREAGWWYQGRKAGREWWSYSWSVSNALQHYLTSSRGGLQAEQVQSPYELDLGDVIFYDWDGDGAYQHSTIVTGFDAAGEPLVNAHTANSRARLWSYRDSPAWTERTRYRFFHVADYF